MHAVNWRPVARNRALLKVETNKASLTSGVTQFAILGDEPGVVSMEQVPIEANFGTYLKSSFISQRQR
jgi:hypothetical protein